MTLSLHGTNMEDRFEHLPETFNEMMLLPNVPDFCTSHGYLTKIHQIITAGGALLEKEEHHRTKGWTVSLDSTGCVSQIVLLGGWIKDFGTVSCDDRNGFAEIVAE